MRKEIGIGGDIGDAATGDRLRQFADIAAADGERPAARLDQAGKHHRQSLAALAGDGHVLRCLDDEGDTVQQLAIALVDHDEVGGDDVAVKRLRRIRGHILRLGRQHAIGLELLDHLLVLDLNVLQLLVPVQQFLDRSRQILVGRDHRDESADVETAGDREVAADEIEQEGRHLGEQIVQELHGELQLVEPEADTEDQAQPAHDIGALEVRGVVDVNHRRAVDGFGDAPGELAGRQLAFTPEPQDGLAQRGDDRQLKHKHADCDQAEIDALRQDEQERGQRLAAEEGRLHEGIADEAAERLDLVLDHGGDFRLLHLAEVRQRKSQHPVEQFVAQAAQHALAHAPLQRVDLELEATIYEHEHEECQAEGDQVGDPVQLETVEDPDGFRLLQLRRHQAAISRGRSPDLFGVDRQHKVGYFEFHP